MSKKPVTIALKFLLVFMVFLLVQKTTQAVEIDPPSLADAQEKIERIFNIVFISAAAVFVAVVAYGIWKSSLAAGDPRGLEGAKQTWTYALYGFMVVLLFFFIFAMAQKFLGIPVLTPKVLLNRVFNAITSLITISTRSDGS